MTTETFLKIGKYGRPIFWSFLMVYSFKYLTTITYGIVFQGQWRWLLEGVSSVFVSLLILLILLISASLSTYKVTHPLLNKDSETDSQWAVGIIILVPVVILQIICQHLFNFNLIGFLS